MKTDEFRALMEVVEALVEKRIEQAFGRDSLHEVMRHNEAVAEFMDKFGEEPR